MGKTPKTLHNTDQDGARKNVKDIKIFGEDLFVLLSKAASQSEGWMKSTKAMEVAGGCVVQVTTQQELWSHEKEEVVQIAVAEALTYVPGVQIATIHNHNNEITGRRLVPIKQGSYQQ